MKNQKNMTLPKEQNKAPATNSNEMEIYGLPEGVKKIILSSVGYKIDN